MTDTTHDVRLLCGCYDTLANRVLGDRMHANMTAIGAPKFTEEERHLARQLQASVGEVAVAKAIEQMRKHGAEVAPGTELYEAVAAQWGYGEVGGGSTDVGDVSYVVPTAQVNTVTAPIATPGHSWQNVVAVGSSIGQKGMRYAAQVMATTCCDLMRDPELVSRAQAEFREATAGSPYVSPVRDVAEPPLNG
jgi:aminobenzoyl-glutamate utilization protein B